MNLMVENVRYDCATCLSRPPVWTKLLPLRNRFIGGRICRLFFETLCGAVRSILGTHARVRVVQEYKPKYVNFYPSELHFPLIVFQQKLFNAKKDVGWFR